MDKSKRDMNIYTVICLCALCAGVNIFFLAMENRGFLVVADDFNAQQIPFTVALHKQIVKYGIDSWIWEQRPSMEWDFMSWGVLSFG